MSTLAAVVGQIISLTPCVGDVARIMTRSLYAVVNTKMSWNSTVELSKEAYAELMVWNQTWIASIVGLLGYLRLYRRNLFTLTLQIMPVDPLSKMKTKFFNKIGHLPSGRKAQHGGS